LTYLTQMRIAIDPQHQSLQISAATR